jgi:hypothetical protein
MYTVIAHRFPLLSKKDNTRRSNPGLGYSPVATNNDGDNIEMQRVTEKVDTDQYCDEGDNDDENGFNQDNEDTSDWNEMETLRTSWREKILAILNALPATLMACRMTLLGLALSLSGITCFALQTRQSYWYLHSLWHILVMSSTLPLLYGRGIFVNLLASFLYVPVRGNAALKRPGY